MATGFERLLEATIQHLEQLKSEGVKFVPVSREALAALSGTATQRPTPVGNRRSGAAAPDEAGVRPATVARPAVTSFHPAPAPPTKELFDTAAPAMPARAPLCREAKESAMLELRTRALACQKCPHLAASRKNVVFGVGDIHSPLMFVGEAPGADEDEQGEPFVGRAGQLLTRIIQTMDFSRDSVYIANILKCRPDTPGQSAGNRKPTSEEMNTCLPYLQEQIDLIQPRVIVALGATAVEGLLGKVGGITRLRGTWREFRGTPLMPTYHPAYLLRNQALSEKRKVWEDMLQVLTRLGRPISEKQQNYFLKA